MKKVLLPTLALLACLIIVAGCKKKTPLQPKPTAVPAATPVPTATPVPANTPVPTATPDFTGLGINWTQATAAAAFSARVNLTSVVFDDGTGPKMWVIGGQDGGGYKNDVWSSVDGVTWVQATAAAAFSARYVHTSVVFDDGTGSKMWVIGGQDGGGYMNDVWSSDDGVTWVQATAAAGFSARSTHSSVVFDDGTGLKMWVIAGYDASVKNDVWSSVDGVTWVQATAAAAFSARLGQTSVVFDDGTGPKMWVIGGWDGPNKNDVWSSDDGVTWVQATAAAAFSARRYLLSVVINSKMWVIGGYDGGYMNDVWSSVDGVTWDQATAAAAFSARRSQTSVVFNSKIWVSGGFDGAYLNDVWYSP